MIDAVIEKFVRRETNNISTPVNNIKTIDVRYCAQMHNNYHLDEKILRQIIGNCVTVNDRNRHRLQFSIYYKNKKSHSMITRNGPHQHDSLQSTNVVYKFTCPLKHTSIETYIGHTRTTLSRRLTMHLQGGSIAAHFQTTVLNSLDKHLWIIPLFCTTCQNQLV